MYCGIDPRGIKSKRAVRDLALAKALMYTCHEMYHRMVMHIHSYILAYSITRFLFVFFL